MALGRQGRGNGRCRLTGGGHSRGLGVEGRLRSIPTRGDPVARALLARYADRIRPEFRGPGEKLTPARLRYREDIDGFVLPQPYPSWILDTNTGKWHAPVAVPTEPTWEELRSRDPKETYVWDEDTTSWVIQVGEIPELQF